MSGLWDLWNVVAGVGLPGLAAAVSIAGGLWAWIRVGHTVGAALLVLGAVLGARAVGYLEARADCQDGQLRAQVEQLEASNAELEKRMAIAAAVARGAAETAIDARKNAAEWKGKADALESERSKAPGPVACNWSRDERRRLLEIPVGQPAGRRPDSGAR